MDNNTLRRLNYLWKHRHKHDGENFQQQIQIIRQTVESQADEVAAGGSGAFVHLERAASQSLGTSAEAIEWDRLNALFVPLEFLVSPPVTEVTILKAGYYDIEVAFALASTYDGGGSVSVRRNGAAVWPPSVDADIWTTDNGRRFAGVAKGVDCKTGDTISVEVEHNSGSTVDLEWAQCSIELVDRVSTRTPQMLVQARWWADGAAEPDSWNIQYVWADPVTSGKVGIDGPADVAGGRLCDWIGVAVDGAAAPQPGDSGGTFTDFGTDTVGVRPAGWSEAYGSAAENRIAVEAVAMSTSPDGKSLRMSTGNAAAGDKGLKWDSGPTVGGVVDMVGAVASQSNDDTALALIPVLDAGNNGIAVRLDPRLNEFQLWTLTGGSRTKVVDVAQAFSANTWYRVRVRAVVI